MNEEMIMAAKIEMFRRINELMLRRADDLELRIQGLIGVMEVIEGKRVIQ